MSTSKRSATSATVRAIGPRWSNDVLSGTTPSHEISPIVALSPTVPHAAEGMRIDPPVSVPSAPKHMPAASAAAAPPLDPPADREGSMRIAHRSEGGLLARRAERELVEVGLADDDRASGAKIGDGRRVRVRLGRGQGRPCRRLCSSNVDQVLDGQRNAVQGPAVTTGPNLALGCPRLGQRQSVESLDESVDLWPGPDLLQARLNQRDRRDSARLHERRNVDDLTEVRAHGS